MGRFAPAFGLLLAACSPGPSRSSVHAAPAEPARTHFEGDVPSPSRAFRISIPRPNGQIVYFDVSSSGELFQWVTPYQRPDPPAVVVLRADWTFRRVRDDEVYFRLRKDDGALLPTRYEPDMLCVARRDGTVNCRCDGHTPVVDVTYSITGTDLVASQGNTSVTAGSVTPAPEDAVQRIRVLAIVAERTYGLDDHGDSAHDIDH